MFLKSLEIFGFKSFATKIRFEFKPGVTAIVGPNGCGKSNVVDALRWALGEANARSLRGEVMDDVIFSGSDERKPLGMAEVSITVVNDDELLPIEYSEVNITRRLYRSGESEFFINKNSVRLKDIHELFADTGIGKAAYSIMEQGNIDLILSNKPEERMSVFEEAAGITRYKMRMKQSYKKLAATEENLIRLNLILSEVEKEYNTLKRQAEKALEYRKLKRQEQEHETLFNYLRMDSLRQQMDQNNKQLSQLRDKKAARKEELEILNNGIRENIEKVRSVENEISEIRNRMYKTDAELESVSAKSQHIQDRIYEIKNEITKKTQLEERIKTHRSELEGKMARLNRESESILELVISQEEKLAQYRDEVEYINEALNRAAFQIEQNTAQIGEVEQNVRLLREDLKEVTDKLLKEIDSIKAKFKGNEKRKNDLIKRISHRIAQMENSLRHHGTKLKDLRFGGKGPDTEILVEEIERIRTALEALRGDIETVIKIQDDLSQVIFGKESMHSRKEQIESSIEQHHKDEKNLKKQIDELNEEVRKNSEKKEKFSSLIGELLPDIARNREKQKHYEENIKRIRGELDRSDESLQDVQFDVQSLTERLKQLESEVDRLTDRNRQLEKGKGELGQKTKGMNALIDQILEQIRKSEAEVSKKNAEQSKLGDQIDKDELTNAELKSKMQIISENFKDRYGVSLELLDSHHITTLAERYGRHIEQLDLKKANELRERTKKEIAELGQVNLIAIEEFEEVKKRFEYLTSQKSDLEKAKEDIHVVLEKTMDHSKELFMWSFEKIKQNFNGIFRRLFNGGKTDLFLINEKNIFESGVEIIACPPGKSLKRRSLLSGGEKGLTAIALLFAIFMEKPSPFSLLDEVDHDLDEENVLRFIKLLKEFTETTQFIIITHNRRTIEFADVIYGITMEEAGISKVVSLDLVEHAIE